MITHDFKGVKLSGLGLGAMRLPTVEGKENQPDQDKVNEMVAYAMEQGINYFDTAWGYHGGQSEIVLGNALKKFDRSQYYLADKFPGYDLDNMPHVEEIFTKQLQKCQTEYFDFYLFHNVCEKNIDAYLDPQYQILDYLLKQKEQGRICHLGFSCHGEMLVLKRFLKEYGKHMEFCQLQINYVDWKFQHAKEKVELLDEYGIDVWVMEPLRGGKLAQLKPEYESRLHALRPTESIPAWAFRFLQSIPQIKMVLFGMSNMQQLHENIETWSTKKTLNDTEKEVLFSIVEEMTKKIVVPCTSCRYCTSRCPQGLDIPRLLSLYNEYAFSQGGFIAPMVVSTLKDKGPGACIQCHSCEKVCPQQIHISEVLQDFVYRLR